MMSTVEMDRVRQDLRDIKQCPDLLQLASSVAMHLLGTAQPCSDYAADKARAREKLLRMEEKSTLTPPPHDFPQQIADVPR